MPRAVACEATTKRTKAQPRFFVRRLDEGMALRRSNVFLKGNGCRGDSDRRFAHGGLEGTQRARVSVVSVVMKHHSVYWHMADVGYRVNKFFAKNILRKEQQTTTMARALEENNTGPLLPWTPPRP